MPKNPRKAREWLETYLPLLDEYGRQPRGDWARVGKRAEELYDLLVREQERIKRVVEDLVPDRIWTVVGGEMAWEAFEREHILRALGWYAGHPPPGALFAVVLPAVERCRRS